ncbi:pyridoxamine 5'-phosphate oxidase family protein [Candidatus Nomurabacteria bacterium]|nr:pyridoxamine 5'-phosphate oxidase family protein [Candidatus Nomurabacteria bacterium]
MDKQLLKDLVAFLGLQKSRLGVVSTISKENTPESAFVYFAFDENINIYFATKDTSRKFKNITHNKNVSFAVATENPPQTLQLEGIATVHNDIENQKDLFQDLVALASSKHFSPPISQQTEGGLEFIKISPTWIRFGNFEVRKHGDTFKEVKIND